jgi:ribosomal protein L7/L12
VKKEPPKKGRREAGKKTDDKKNSAPASADKADKAEKPADPSMPMPAHLFVGVRDVKVKLEKADYERVLSDQQELRKAIAEATQHLINKQTQIDEVEEKRTRLKAEYREIEGLIEESKERILSIIDANSNGHHIDRMEVDEVFINGEIVTYKKGTKEEVGERRNAQPAEWEAAKQVKTDGKPVDRWQKGMLKPASRKGFVVIDGGKDGEREVRASADGYGYIGPDEDPTKPVKEDKKKGGAKKEREPKTLPRSLEPLDPPKEEKAKPGPQQGTFALRLVDAGANEIGAMTVIRKIVDVGAGEAKKLVTGKMPVEVTRDLTEDNARLMVQMFSDVGVKADCVDVSAAVPSAPPPDPNLQPSS